uniref:VCBS domain-containing protein n=1 Tax=Methylobacterium nigriterrae TaxID=3127512 RepID=UPI003013AE46
RLLFTVSDPGQAFLVRPSGPQQVTVEQVAKTPFNIQTEAGLVQAIFKTLADVPRLPVPQGPAAGGAGSGTAPNILHPEGGPQEGLRPGGAPPGSRDVTPRDGAPDRGDTDRHDGVIPHAGENPDRPRGSGEETPHLVLASQNVAVLQDTALAATNAGEGVLPPSAGASASGLRIVAAHAGSDAAADAVALTDGRIVLAGHYGTLVLYQDGTYLYRADQASALAEGQHGTDAFSFQVQDDAGTVATATLTVDITGVNDAPVLAADTAANHAPAGIAGVASGNGTKAAAATLSFTDVDLNDTHSVTYAGPSVTWSGGPAVPTDTASALLSALTLTATDSTGTGTGTGSVTAAFALADRLAAFLAEGETLTATYDVTVTDNHGVASTRPVTFTLTGTNDAPILAPDPAASHVPIEIAGLTAGSGTRAAATLSFADVDLNDTHTVSGSLTSAAWSAGAALPVGTASALVSALTLTATNSTGTGAGSVTAAFALADTPAAFLAAGETLTATYDVTVTDNHGAASTRPVAFTLTGTNDAPVLAPDTAASRAVTQVAGTTGCTAIDVASATLPFTDADLSDTHTVRLGAPRATWSAGSLTCLTATDAKALTDALDHALSVTLSDATHTGSGSVDLAFSAPDQAFDFLAACETLTVTYDVTVTDNHGAASTRPVAFTLTGTNDAPSWPIPVAAAPGAASAPTQADLTLGGEACHAVSGGPTLHRAEVAKADHVVHAANASGSFALPGDGLLNAAGDPTALHVGGVADARGNGPVTGPGGHAPAIEDSPGVGQGSVAYEACSLPQPTRTNAAVCGADDIPIASSGPGAAMPGSAGHDVFVFAAAPRQSGPVHDIAELDATQDAIGLAFPGDPAGLRPTGNAMQGYDPSISAGHGAMPAHFDTGTQPSSEVDPFGVADPCRAAEHLMMTDSSPVHTLLLMRTGELIYPCH